MGWDSLFLDSLLLFLEKFLMTEALELQKRRDPRN
jgi:hypothetical protein